MHSSIVLNCFKIFLEYLDTCLARTKLTTGWETSSRPEIFKTINVRDCFLTNHIDTKKKAVSSANNNDRVKDENSESDVCQSSIWSKGES